MDELVIVEGKARLKERRASPQTITDEQIETFFETLGDSRPTGPIANASSTRRSATAGRRRWRKVMRSWSWS